MAIKKRQFTREYKLQVLQEIQTGKSIAQTAREHQIHPTLLGKWRKSDESMASGLLQVTAMRIRMTPALPSWSG